MAAALEQVNEILALLSEIKEMPLNRESCKYFLCVLFHFLILFSLSRFYKHYRGISVVY